MNAPVLIGLITICSWAIADGELHQLKTTKCYEKLKNKANQHAVYIYNIVSDNERENAFGLGVRDLLAVVDGHLDSVDLEIPLAYVDCKDNKLEGLCDVKDATPDKDFFLIMLYDNRRDSVLRLQPRDSKLDEHDLLDLILRFYSLGWQSFRLSTNSKEVRQTIEASPQKDWFVCFADREYKKAKTFCLELAASYRKRPAINVIQIEKRPVLQDLKKEMNVELELPSRSSAHGLWYLDCLEDEGIQCKAYQYLMDATLTNVKQFVQMVRYPPVVEMAPCGSVPDLNQLQAPLLYYFYRGVKLRWDAAKTQAFDIGSQLRGAVIVVVADVDELKENVLVKFGLSAKRDEFPVWRLKLLATENKNIPPGLIHVEGCPVQFVRNKILSLFESASETTFEDTVIDSLVDDNDVDPKMQDDEVEILLQSQRDESCYFCPPDYKRVTVLTDKTYAPFIEKRTTAIVLFWLNVDTTSRAALATTIEASGLLDPNFAPFASVACHDWPDVCQKASVKSWPKMIVFSNGQRMRDYKSIWDPKLLANTAMLYATSALTQLTSVKDLENFIQSKTIRLINDTYLQTVTVGLFKNEKARQIRAFTEAAKRLHGQYVFGLASGSWLKEWVNERMGPLELPVIVTHKNNDELEKAVLMDEVEEATPESIIRFVHISSRPVIPPLTKLSFPSIISRKVPIIILMAHNPTDSEFFATLRNVEQCLLSRNYVCVTLDADSERNLTKYLLKAYGLHESQLPVVVYVNPKNGHVHLLPQSGSQKSVKIWLEHINSKMVKPNVILPEKTWTQRPLMYDYLELTKTARSQATPKDADSSWSKQANARPWGSPEYASSKSEMEAHTSCARNKKIEGDRKLAMGKEQEGNDAGHQDWPEAHECPMKKMTEELRRKEEENRKKNVDHETNSESADPGDDNRKYAKNDEELIISKNTRKITKEILEEEEKKAQSKRAANDEDGRDEL